MENQVFLVGGMFPFSRLDPQNGGVPLAFSFITTQKGAASRRQTQVRGDLVTKSCWFSLGPESAKSPMVHHSFAS